jgi:hypothetical protein
MIRWIPAAQIKELNCPPKLQCKLIDVVESRFKVWQCILETIDWEPDLCLLLDEQRRISISFKDEMHARMFSTENVICVKVERNKDKYYFKIDL